MNKTYFMALEFKLPGIFVLLNIAVWMKEDGTRHLDEAWMSWKSLKEGLRGRNAVCIDTFQPEKSGFKYFKTGL